MTEKRKGYISPENKTLPLGKGTGDELYTKYINNDIRILFSTRTWDIWQSF